ncbi:hypothetical protein SAMN04489708_108174 [Paracidovorax cattleyae]|uniref:Uncharacterized protein n=1 Tax=Paracidovorax cattleyae TaxID=80868 RepID=A0A1H0QMF7_9BURK|nr:hypothetical protein SAMN04489708_108174 [Paracidovorax cattleyae]
MKSQKGCVIRAHPYNNLAGHVTSTGNATIKNIIANFASMNGQTPRDHHQRVAAQLAAQHAPEVVEQEGRGRCRC